MSLRRSLCTGHRWQRRAGFAHSYQSPDGLLCSCRGGQLGQLSIDAGPLSLASVACLDGLLVDLPSNTAFLGPDSTVVLKERAARW